MKLILILSLLSTTLLFSNDGAFYSSGNQLVPIDETDIECRKEILSIKRVGENSNTQFEVTVDYTFYNPGQENPSFSRLSLCAFTDNGAP